MADPTREELMSRIVEMERQSTLKKSGKLEFRVAAMGGVSVYGLGRFPVSLYYEQWVRLLDGADALRSFLEENKSQGRVSVYGLMRFRVSLYYEQWIRLLDATDALRSFLEENKTRAS